ncbi:c-type cytochrome [Qipengyuania sp. GH1]|uniref:c-type cytochrome n=1 Tax=Qipengyuania aestuarii TaxID=2867241 RepID=UPI001C88B490|nr:c-type cytochrome [Qipengyuania aestuarii]MBX7536325.1 c-type cytochrome [Qipengyuania aestuarii]
MARSLWVLSTLFLAGCTSAAREQPDESAAYYQNPVPPRLVVVSPTRADGEARAARDYAPLPKDAGTFMKCAACHTLTPGVHGLGPSLAGIYGRPAATRKGYRYSDELSRSGLVWDAATLDSFLASPSERVPGTKMRFRGLSDPADRAQVIALIQRY